MDFGTRLGALLQERRLSQKEIASAVNVAASTMSNYINGVREPDYETLKRIAAQMQVSTDFLLGKEYAGAESAEESELLQLYRMLNREQRALLTGIAKLLLHPEP